MWNTIVGLMVAMALGGLFGCGGAPKCASTTVENEQMASCMASGATGNQCSCAVGAILDRWTCAEINNWSTSIPLTEINAIANGCR